MILMTDLHLKRNGKVIKWWDDTLKLFLEEMTSTLYDENIVICGDIFDKEVNPAEVFDDARYYFEKLVDNGNVLHIIRGNHDFSTLEGCSLKIFERIPNCKVYRELDIVTIEDKQCLMLPHYSQTMRHKEDISDFKTYVLDWCKNKNISKVDYVFMHETIKEIEIKNEGFSVRDELHPLLEASGHIHKRAEGDGWLNLGTPYQSRSDEEGKESYIYRLKDEGEIIKIPIKAKTLEFITIDINIINGSNTDIEFEDTNIHTLSLICNNDKLASAKILERDLREKIKYIRQLKIVNIDDDLALENFESETEGKTDMDIFNLVANNNNTTNEEMKLGLEVMGEVN